MKTSIYNYTRDNLVEYFKTKNSQSFRATQLFEALYKQKINNFGEMSNFKKEFRDILEEDFSFDKLEIVRSQTSSDETKKFLFRLSDGNLIETVLMKHNYGYSVCVTSQVGCNMGCLFCASKETKKVRNLTVSEMVLQVVTIDNLLSLENKRVSHIVIMGIGEPFDNYVNVTDFIRIVNDPKALEIGSRHITISTCGIVPRIYEFADFPLQVNLAISLHFPNNEKRVKYMPITKKYGLDQLMPALKNYIEKTNRRLTIEYIMLDGINDSLVDAKELVTLLRGMNVYVNLIPYNDTSNKMFRRSQEENSSKFFDYLMKNKINAIMRKEQGHDIDAACGQLRVKELEWQKEE